MRDQEEQVRPAEREQSELPNILSFGVAGDTSRTSAFVDGLRSVAPTAASKELCGMAPIFCHAADCLGVICKSLSFKIPSGDFDFRSPPCPIRSPVAVNQGWRSRFHLDPDQTFYWKFLFDELSIVANGDLRLQKMSLPTRATRYFGGFADPQSRDLVEESGWIVRDCLSYGEALAAEYRNGDLE
jgi:hypothetical protein